MNELYLYRERKKKRERDWMSTDGANWYYVIKLKGITISQTILTVGSKGEKSFEHTYNDINIPIGG